MDEVASTAPIRFNGMRDLRRNKRTKVSIHPIDARVLTLAHHSTAKNGDAQWSIGGMLRELHCSIDLIGTIICGYDGVSV